MVCSYRLYSFACTFLNIVHLIFDSLQDQKRIGKTPVVWPKQKDYNWKAKRHHIQRRIRFPRDYPSHLLSFRCTLSHWRNDWNDVCINHSNLPQQWPQKMGPRSSKSASNIYAENLCFTLPQSHSLVEKSIENSCYLCSSVPSFNVQNLSLLL